MVEHRRKYHCNTAHSGYGVLVNSVLFNCKIKEAKMRVYRVNKDGFMESINTVGNYKAPGWYSTPEKEKIYKKEMKKWIKSKQ